jgi:hypothetical protein
VIPTKLLTWKKLKNQTVIKMILKKSKGRTRCHLKHQTLAKFLKYLRLLKPGEALSAKLSICQRRKQIGWAQTCSAMRN